MLRNLRTEGMATEDGPWLSGRSVPLGSMLHPSRHRRWRRFMRSALRRDPWSPDPRTFGGTRRALNDSPQEDPLPTTVLMVVSPDLRSNGEVVELNVAPLDAGALDQLKSKLVKYIPRRVILRVDKR